MTAQKKETAEQQLLKMIEASRVGGAAPKKAEKKSKIAVDLKTVNKFLILAVFVVFVILFYEVYVGFTSMDKTVSSQAVKSLPASTLSEDLLTVPKAQSLAFYTSDAKRRNLFEPYEEKKTAGSVTSGVSKDSLIAQKTKGLKLVGISWLDTVESASVMIEDVNKNVTYFLKKGGKIGDIIVKTIYADSVALGYENEEIIIKYDKPIK